MLDKNLCLVVMKLTGDLSLDGRKGIDGNSLATAECQRIGRFENGRIILPVRTILMAQLIDELRTYRDFYTFNGIKNK